MSPHLRTSERDWEMLAAVGCSVSGLVVQYADF